MLRFFSTALAILMALPFTGCGGNKSDIIVVYGRENNSGTYAYFKDHVLEKEDFMASVQTLPGTAAVINAVSKDPRSIGYGGIGYGKGVKAIPVKKDENSTAVDPTIENVISGKYPISRDLFFYTVGKPSGAVLNYISWILSADGQKICEKVGYYPLPEKRWENLGTVPVSGEETRVTIKGSDTMVILGQRWAEHYMEKNSQVIIQVTGGGSGTGIAAMINGATDICQSSRPMKAKEKKMIKEKFGKEAYEISVALDGLAIFVHENNPMTEISLPQLKAIYTGKVKTWKDVTGGK